MSDNASLFKDTVNLPRTDFPIRAGLATIEPQLLQQWSDNNLYGQMQTQQKNFNKSYILHDGPPYPNGDIHMGHALNKVLKDIVVRFKHMTGYKGRYIPGWDCHGLPIETQVIKALKAENQESKKHDIAWFRNKCREFALSYVSVQKQDFQRLGVVGEWDKPYLTLNPNYEAKVVALFGAMAENGLVYRGRKPIHWCCSCETALAEAEIEYYDKKSPSIYIKFSVTEASEKLKSLINDKPCEILVWTTTPWTLPANVAIAAHPHFTYQVAEIDGICYVFVDALRDRLVKAFGWPEPKILGTLSGADLVGTKTRHPFIDRISPIVDAHYVTKEDGTGFVHIAPGHGAEDYLVGMEHKLPMVMPVDHQGKFTDDVIWKGMPVFEANKPITQHLEQTGRLMKLEFVTHSYPHCWRCKQPVIFRATEQWFIAMDKPKTQDQKTLRTHALEAIRKTAWHPTWGEKRIFSMVENRPDWCISRQRFWGIPIPVFICNVCGHPEMTGAFNQAAVDLVKKNGSTAWFETPVSQILPESARCSQCGKSDFRIERDILDVWFESGSSFAAVLENEPDMPLPASLYLEGSDQHRGWFQSSLLIGIGSRNLPPYDAVLTHGFLVDEKGKKMSKSEGNVISPQAVIKEYGADILRWWVAGSDFKNDISLSKTILNQSRDSFSKVRNTIRFCLSNLYDFDFSHDAKAISDLTEVDRWALYQLDRLIDTVNEAYTQFDFHLVVHGVHDFCSTTLSSLYLDMVKDRLYCDSPASATRRSTQTVMYYLADSLIRLIAPILSFTAEDAYRFLPQQNKVKSIHLTAFPTRYTKQEDADFMAKWDRIMTIKNTVYQKLEQLRNTKTVRSFLEAKVILTLDAPIDFTDWDLVLIVGSVTVNVGSALSVEVMRAEGDKCARCWKVLPLTDSLCVRCHNVVK